MMLCSIIFISEVWIIRFLFVTLRWWHAAIQLCYQVRATNTAQTLLNASSLLRLVPEEELPLGKLLFLSLSAEYWFERIWVVACIPRLCGIGHWRWRKVLNLLQMEVKTFGNHSQFSHIFLVTSWVRRNEVGDDLLSQSLFTINAVEYALEVVELTERWFSHQIQHSVACVLWCHLQAA